MKTNKLKKLLIIATMATTLCGAFTGCGTYYEDDLDGIEDSFNKDKDNNKDDNKDNDETPAGTDTVDTDTSEDAIDVFLKYAFESSDTAPSEEDMNILYDNMRVIEADQTDIYKIWSRTYCSVDDYGMIDVSSIDDASVDVRGEFYHGLSTGDIEANGYFISATNVFIVDYEYDTVYFLTLYGDEMEVTQHGPGCMGAGVTAAGIYTTNVPEYTDD